MKLVKIYIVLLLSLLTFIKCDNYLDIVPDRTQELELIFERRDAAYKALATCYHYLPREDGVYSTYVFASDELTTPIEKETPGIELMRGKQSSVDPIMGYWSGYYAHGDSQESMFRGIRDCNIFIENIDLVADMSEREKAQWKAEVTFLKAYYHFLLLRQYGPIPITDKNVNIAADIEDIRVERNTVDEVFDYITNTIDLAMQDLPERINTNNNLGRIDQVIASAIKSRVLLYAASPLYNGNSEYYETFMNKDGEKYFNTVYDQEKWKKAIDATRNAIDLAESNGLDLYTFNAEVPEYDSSNINTTEVQALYNYRYMFTEAWNNELIWGNSDPIRGGDWWKLQAASMMMNPNSSANEASWQWVSPTLEVVERFYSKNGLPIEEDLTFDYDLRHRITIIPEEDSLHAVSGEATIRLHLNREPRFYASIGFDRGLYRTWADDEIWQLQMRKSDPHGRKASSNDYAITGYTLKKVCHPESEGDAYNKLVTYPWPYIRLAELYLNLAEAMNEYSGPSQEVYDALNKIRERSGIPDVELVWSNDTLARNPGKHLSKEGLREIIRHERSIELSFEGNRYYDVRRWKEGDKYFNKPVRGWTVDESNLNKFYTLINVGQRAFLTPRDYLHPIKEDELKVNPNMDQNPGW